VPDQYEVILPPVPQAAVVTLPAVPQVVEVGVAGPQGLQGPVGPVGPQGPQGEPGVVQADPPITYDPDTQTVGFDGVLSDLNDVDTAGVATNDLLAYDGTEWTPTDRPTVARVSFDTVAPPALDAAGDLAWDDLDQALSYRTNGLTVDIAQENLIYVRNGPGETPITKGMAVSFEGASANRINVRPCVANVPGVGCATAGVALTDIPSPGFGFVSTFGLVRGFNTNNILSAGGPPVTQGQELFISTTPGVVATFPAVSPARRVTVGYVVTTGVQGSIFVTVRRGLTVNELDNVLAANPSNGQALVFNSALGVWQPGAIDAVTSVNGETGDVVLDAADVGAYPATNPDGFVDAAGAAAAAPVQSVNGDTGAVEIDAASIGAYADDNPSGFVDAAGAAAAAPVQSVNGAIGTVVLGAGDVGAYPDTNPSNFIDAAGAPVQSVNTLTGTVVLDAAAVGAYPSGNPSGFVDAAGAAAAAPVQSVNGLSGTVVLDAVAVGAYPGDNPDGFIDALGAPVQSVNALTGTVVLDAAAVGAYPATNPSGFVDAAGAALAAPVQSVNGASGTVVLGATDVGAIGTAFGLYVEDYSTAPSVRPVAAAVYWRGTVAPGTAVAQNGDLWYDTTGD
jgi:hypothetical protein